MVKIIFVVVALASLCSAQPSESEYVEYIQGEGLPVILSAPHGGELRPSSIPDRDAGCFIDGECVYNHECSPKDTSQ